MKSLYGTMQTLCELGVVCADASGVQFHKGLACGDSGGHFLARRKSPQRVRPGLFKGIGMVSSGPALKGFDDGRRLARSSIG